MGKGFALVKSFVQGRTKEHQFVVNLTITGLLGSNPAGEGANRGVAAVDTGGDGENTNKYGDEQNQKGKFPLNLRFLIGNVLRHEAHITEPGFLGLGNEDQKLALGH